MTKATYIRVAIAYLTYEGYNELSLDIEKFLKAEQDNRLDFIVGFSSYCITEPAALSALIKLKVAFPNQVKVGYYYNEGFHPKMFIFESGKTTSVILGSSNLTWQGMNINVEANIALARSTESVLVQSIQKYFGNLMDYAALDIELAHQKYVKIYRSSYGKNRVPRKSKRDFGLSRTSLPPQFFEPEKDAKKLLFNRKMLWKIAPCQGGCEWDEWIDSEGNGRIAIGWGESDEIGSLTKFRSQKELQAFIEKNRTSWGKSWNSVGGRGGQKDPSWYVAQQLWRFYKGTRKGDAVLAYSDKTIFALGVINGAYDYTADSQFYEHRKSVRWFAVPKLRITSELSKRIGFRQTIYPVQSPSTIKEILKLLFREFR